MLVGWLFVGLNGLAVTDILLDEGDVALCHWDSKLTLRTDVHVVLLRVVGRDNSQNFLDLLLGNASQHVARREVLCPWVSVELVGEVLRL